MKVNKNNIKPTGFIQKLNYKNQITLPFEILRKAGIQEFDSLEIFLNDDNHIILKKFNKGEKR